MYNLFLFTVEIFQTKEKTYSLYINIIQYTI
jgi:hypothetical protein